MHIHATHLNQATCSTVRVFIANLYIYVFVQCVEFLFIQTTLAPYHCKHFVSAVVHVCTMYINVDACVRVYSVLIILYLCIDMHR